MADSPRDDVAPAAGRAGDHLRDRPDAEAVSEAAASEENDAPPAETGWEKERGSFLTNLVEGRTMPRRKSAGSHMDQHGASERFDSPREYVCGELSGKRRTPSVLNQTSQMLSSAGHALSGDGDEAVVILGALAGVAIGTALGIAEKRRQAAEQQVTPPHDDPPQSSLTKRTEAPHDDSSQPSPTQATAEPLQDAASQQIEQPMEQSM